MGNLKADVTIIGAGLTGLTAALYLKKAGMEVLLIEKAERAGGVIRTIKKDGFIFEAGPNTGVYSSGELVRLFDDLGNRCTPEFANQKGKQRWIWKSGKWHALPSGLASAIRTPLFSFSDKLRILGEPFRRKGTDPYETVSQLVKRRMGKSYLEYAVDPFISGIYAGDPDRLVTQFALPKLYHLEQEYGSFIGGAMKKRKEPKDELTKRATKEVFSVKGGLQNLTDAISEEIGKEKIILNTSGLTISYNGSGFLSSFQKNKETVTVKSESLITTTGSHALPKIFSFLSMDELKPLTDLQYAKVTEVVAAWRSWPGLSLDAFGGLIPSKEKRMALGILFTSSIFSGRTPEGGAILSVFMGGMRHPEIAEMSDEKIRELALKEIRETLQTGDHLPDHLEVFRYEHAIPQYEKNSEQRLATIGRIESKYPGLLLGGNIRDGIGMADRVKQGYMLAKTIINR